MFLTIDQDGRMQHHSGTPTPAAVSDALGGAIPYKITYGPLAIHLRDDAASLPLNQVGSVVAAYLSTDPSSVAPVLGPVAITADGGATLSAGNEMMLMLMAATVANLLRQPPTSKDAARVHQMAAMAKSYLPVPDGYPSAQRMEAEALRDLDAFLTPADLPKRQWRPEPTGPNPYADGTEGPQYV